MAGIGPDNVRLEGHDPDTSAIARCRCRCRRVRTQTGTDAFFWGLINFRGPALLEDLKSRTYPTYSAFDLLSSEQQLLSGDKPDIDPAVFRDKIVFVGATASGLFDVFETPFSNGKMPGHQHPRGGGRRHAVQPLHAARVARRHASRRCSLMALAVGAIAARIPAWWATAVDGRHRGRLRGGRDAGLRRAATG